MLEKTPLKVFKSQQTTNMQALSIYLLFLLQSFHT